ncbi:hypothetical protein L6R49_25650 [Myxococcota bacterium]|nr:hypothetical protein [Myxococcota bacterium]
MIRINAEYWLEHTLWPIARAAAGLPDDAEPDPPEEPPDRQSGAADLALQHAAALELLGAVHLACELARTPRACALGRAVRALIWRDALALASARDLVVSIGMAGETWDEMTDRHILAIEVWARWTATDEAVAAARGRFLADCAEYAFEDDAFSPEP